MNSVTQMIVATPIAVVLGVFAGLMFSMIQLGSRHGTNRVVARSAAAVAMSLVPLALTTMLTDQLWIGSCVPFGIALAYEREERPPLGAFVVGAQTALIIVSFPFIWAATAWALEVGS
jgi:hypothetical protein